jgi:hypothetical protein
MAYVSAEGAAKVFFEVLNDLRILRRMLWPTGNARKRKSPEKG